MSERTAAPDAQADLPDDDALVHVRMPLVLDQRDAAALLDQARARATDPAIFDEFPPVFFEVRASDNTLDSFSTRMQPSTLQNYANDAGDGDGVPFLDSHDGSRMGNILGRSLAGKYTRGSGDRPARTEATFYTQPTMLPAMQEFVNRARAGYARDVSVGFSGGRTVCSICGGEMYRWYRSAGDGPQCYHIPGVEYAVVDESGTKTGDRQVAIGLIEDARLREVSTVYAGSNDNAHFIGFKARQLQDAGLLRPEVRSAVEQKYGVIVPGPHRAWAAAAREEDPAMPTDKTAATPTPTADEITAIREGEASRWVADLTASLRQAGIEVADDADPRALVRSLAGEVVTLRPLADDGKAWRATLVTAAIAEGVRAFGDAFAAERQRARLERMAPDDILLESQSWAQIAERALPGGQATRVEAGEGQDGKDGKQAPAIPAAAYKSSR